MLYQERLEDFQNCLRQELALKVQAAGSITLLDPSLYVDQADPDYPSYTNAFYDNLYGLPAYVEYNDREDTPFYILKLQISPNDGSVQLVTFDEENNDANATIPARWLSLHQLADLLDYITKKEQNP